MTDIDKVLTGLECLITNEIPCEECPYYGSGNCRRNVSKEAKELIQYQHKHIEEFMTCQEEKINKPQKPALGVAPYYVSAWRRIGELTEAIQRQYEQADGDPKLVDQWAKEIGWQCALLESMKEDD